MIIGGDGMEKALMRRGLIKKLCLLHSMNTADWICTAVLLRTGRFFEANPLSALFIGDISAGFIIKCIVPSAAILLIARAAAMLDADGLRTADRWICFGLAFYTAVSVDHVVNFILLFTKMS
jgi:hypothetical protein